MSFDGAISRIKKTILKNIEKCWSKINPVFFVHSSDLMLPGDKELTGIQLIVISRMLDIESRKTQKGYYWHIRISELSHKKKYSPEKKEELDEKFERFFHAMEIKGFNPEISHISIAHLPIMGQADGTHRLGYLLCEKSNVFVPAQIMSPISWVGQPIYGISWLSQIGMTSEEIEQLLKRYQMLYNEMRRIIIAVVDKNVFDQNSTVIVQEIGCIGKCESIKYAHKKSNDSKALRQYKKFLKHKEKIIILEIKIEHQFLYYKHGKLKSKLADILTDRLRKVAEADIYVAGTITESIALETYLDENYVTDAYMTDNENV